MKIEPHESQAYKHRWKIVDTSDYSDVPGEIISADDVTGEATVERGGETVVLPTLGQGSIKIVGRRK